MDSSLAMMPPAAPDPTITKSTMSLGRKRAAGRGCLLPCQPLPVDVGVVVAERRLEARLMLEPEHVPAGVVAVAAPRRQREGADDGVEARGLEERRLLDVVEQLVLLRGRQRGEAGAPLPPCARRGDSGRPRRRRRVFFCAALNVASARSMK